jgi:hypothetical protein
LLFPRRRDDIDMRDIAKYVVVYHIDGAITHIILCNNLPYIQNIFFKYNINWLDDDDKKKFYKTTNNISLLLFI